MKILGIDYGEKKVGLAISEGPLASPFRVIRYKDPEELPEKIKRIASEEQIEKIVVGITEGKLTEKIKKFADELRGELAISVETWDETLSTKDAQKLSIEAGIKRSKRKAMEDAFAASIMLQSFLDR